MFCRNKSLNSLFQKHQHHLWRLHQCILSSLERQSLFIEVLTCFELNVGLFFRTQQAEGQGKKVPAITVIQSQHSKSKFHASFVSVIHNGGKEFHFLASLTTTERIVNDYNSPSRIIVQCSYVRNATHRQEQQEFLPVDIGGVKKTVCGILAEDHQARFVYTRSNSSLGKPVRPASKKTERRDNR